MKMELKRKFIYVKKRDGVLLLGMKLIIHTHKRRTNLDQEQRVTLIPTYLVLVEVQQEDQDIQLEFTRSLQLMKCYHPLLIFDKDAEKVVNYKVKCSWGEGLPLITGKFGLEDELEFPIFISVTKYGSMNDSLFCKYILDRILCLYPNITQKWVFDEEGGILSGPVLIKTDAGPGRLCANFANIEFRQKLERMGCHIILGLPNATSVSAEMDDLYREYKGCCRQKTQEVF